MRSQMVGVRGKGYGFEADRALQIETQLAAALDRLVPALRE